MIDKGRFNNEFIWNPSISECQWDKSCDVGQHLDYKDCKCRKKLIDKLVQQCSEDINGNNMIHNVTLNNYEKVFNSYIVLLVIALIIIISIGCTFIYFYWFREKHISAEHINMVANHEKILIIIKLTFQKKLILINPKKKKWKQCMIFHYCYYLDINFTDQREVCDRCRDVSMMAYELENIAILNVKCVDYRCVIRNMTRNDAIDRLSNSKLDDKGSLWIWILVQIKHLLE